MKAKSEYIRKGVIVTFGSQRLSDQFLRSLDNSADLRVVHIIDNNGIGVCKDFSMILREYEAMGYSKKDIIAFISFARNTIKNSVQNIAKVMDILRADENYFHCRFIGPDYNSAVIFSDKGKTTRELNRGGFNTLKTLPIGDNSMPQTKNLLARRDMSFPLVGKATNFTGGAGMRLLNNIREIKKLAREHAKEGADGTIVTEFLEGHEVSIEMIILGKQYYVFPMSVKDSTDQRMRHGDSKVKVCGLLRNFPLLEEEVIAIAKTFGIGGYFAVEGILYDPGNLRWKVMEGMTRFTGSFPMFNASVDGFDTMRAMSCYIQRKDWFLAKSFPRVTIQVPVFKEKPMFDDKNMKLIPEWVVQQREDDLSKLPMASHHKEFRTQITFLAGENMNECKARLKKLQDIYKDDTISTRVLSLMYKLLSIFPHYTYGNFGN